MREGVAVQKVFQEALLEALGRTVLETDAVVHAGVVDQAVETTVGG